MTMLIEWQLFLPALLLLLVPGDLLMSPRIELLSFDRAGNRSSAINRQRWVYVRWMEPVRGFGGAYLLQISLPLTTDLWDYLPGGAYGLFLGLLIAGVVAQLITRRAEGALLAPIGYVMGVVFALVPWPLAMVGLVSGITSIFAFRQLHAFFGFSAATVGLVGLLFESPVVWLVPAVGLLFMPLLAGLMTGRALEMPVPADTTG